MELINLVKALGGTQKWGWFDPKGLEGDKEIPKGERKAYLDGSQIMAVVPKKEKVKEVIEQMFDVTPAKPPKIEYKEKGCLYAVELLQHILKLTKDYGYITISTGTDKPMKVETDDFDIWLAPRVENKYE